MASKQAQRRRRPFASRRRIWAGPLFHARPVHSAAHYGCTLIFAPTCSWDTWPSSVQIHSYPCLTVGRCVRAAGAIPGRRRPQDVSYVASSPPA